MWDALWTIVRGTPRTHWESHSLAPWVADWERVHEATDHRATNGTRDHILGAFWWRWWWSYKSAGERWKGGGKPSMKFFSSALKHSFVIKSLAKQKTRFNLKCIWQCFCVRSTGSFSSFSSTDSHSSFTTRISVKVPNSPPRTVPVLLLLRPYVPPLCVV